ncbi:MAG: hydroxysqualene dehydroxylase HpnE [Rhizomicrobium sp.]|jgi:squalene-associated FAD-dependent desaturase
MRQGKVYVAGAGLAGLGAATALAERGRQVEVLEAAPQAGGRCRSYFDPQLGQVIDNGNHFVLSGNHATMTFLDRTGAKDGLEGPAKAGVSCVDIRSGEHWSIAPNDGPIPFWLFSERRRVPGTRPKDYAEIGRLLALRHDRPLRDVLSCKGVLWDRLFEPFFVGALNTRPEDASAMLAAALVQETFAKGGRAYRIRIAHPTLASVFIDPALRFLEARGGSVSTGQRLREIVFDDERHCVIALVLPDRTIPVAIEDSVVLAVPPWVATELLPRLTAPDDFRSIVNAHFKIPAPAGAPLMLGVIGGTAQWIFSFTDRISVTISNADAIVNDDREALAQCIWADVTKALELSAELPPWQIVKEKRATFAATPEQAARRPLAKTRWSNLVLAGDWTDTGLPATIEGAIRSGHRAAELVSR